MHLYLATEEAEERRIALLSRSEQAREQAALRESQPSRFVRVPAMMSGRSRLRRTPDAH